ncbi:transaldolase [Xylanimonas cellulosilytica DSM 15894]|uniref:Transaldolase n=1 Tax=Xylanimonas cellulosilytica (strain DSM 15894 / JCM 12276 / CECT 5975 / KCTC 9989 / LMG 20990 / NBRC 107835 / XIL07) TaxID=446471 RepID=D1BS94_XYLCX|nr:transaldolase [Xylanimonas cellulosilytica]ACZ30586.1 transaldolase [Xylanimonas cellulosilytica DSM 15894]
MTSPTDTRPTHRLSEAGVSIWLDDLSRERLATGNLAALVAEKDVVGVTTNPTIFAAALGTGDAYASALAELAGTDVEAAVERITTDDVREAADVLRPVFDATHAVDGRVSIEVDPRLARDTERTVATAVRLWETVGRPNVMIKIPATLEGLPAITRTLAQGISVNVTLIFSIERYRAVLDAWLAGLEQAQANGHDLAGIGSVASFFVSRVDAAVDAALEKVGTEEALALRGKAAIANARLAYAAYRDVVGSERWAALQGAGAQPQRPLWASTGVKNPEYRDTLYVDELVVAGVVNTMPQATLDAFADHGIVLGDTVTGTADDAAEQIAAIEAQGISLADVTARLETEGVSKFEASWSQLLETTQAGLDAAAFQGGAA